MTKPDDIPQDIMDVADKIAVDDYMQPDLEKLASAIARAILAERERCAKVAGDERIECPLDCEEDEAYNLAIDHVIAAIRSCT